MQHADRARNRYTAFAFAFGLAIVAAATFVGASAVPVSASPIECVNWKQTATSQAVMNACSAQDAQRSSQLVAARYLASRTRLADGRRKALDASQRAWAKYRETYCAQKAAEVSGGSMQPLVMNSCVDTLNVRRANDLFNDR